MYNLLHRYYDVQFISLNTILRWYVNKFCGINSQREIVGRLSEIKNLLNVYNNLSNKLLAQGEIEYGRPSLECLFSDHKPVNVV